MKTQHILSLVSTSLLCLGLASFNAPAQPPSAYEADLSQFLHEIAHEYAALGLKEKQGLNFGSIQNQYLSEVKNVTTQREFHRLIQRLIAEFHDSHFSSKVPTQDFYSLGFETDLIDNKVVIKSINRNVLSPSVFPAQVGDEISLWNGQPVTLELAQVQRYIGKSNPQTTRRYSAMLLPQREIQEVPIPQGSTVTLTIQSQGRPIQLSLPWLKGQSKDFSHPYCDRDQSGFPLPPGSVVLKPGQAYYHPHPSRPGLKVGYLRIPDYLVAPHELVPRLKEYGQLLGTLEQNSDVLVLDQSYNCGGNVEFAEILMGFFHSEPYQPVQYRFLTSAQELAHWKSVQADMHAKRPEAAARLSPLISLIESTPPGQKLTAMSSLFGQRSLPPRPIYTHPILLLVNEFSGSAGDVFPSYMQYSGRATLMGQRTMGAGGHARPGFTLKHTQIKIKIPKMLFYLPNGKALENRGATPDVLYQESLSDVLSGYAPYQKAYLAQVLKPIKP